MKEFLIRNIILVLMVFGFTACGRQYTSPNYKEITFQEEKHALVVISSKTRPGPRIFFGVQRPVSFDIVKIYPKEQQPVVYRVEEPLLQQQLPWRKPFIFLMVKPGLYAIDNISCEYGNTKFYTIAGPIAADHTLNWGGFCVKPGEVSYIGSLEFTFNHNDRQAQANVVDEFDKAKAYLEENHPSLSGKLTKGLFLPAGTKLPIEEVASDLTAVQNQSLNKTKGS